MLAPFAHERQRESTRSDHLWCRCLGRVRGRRSAHQPGVARTPGALAAVSDLAFALQNKDSDEGAVNAVLPAQSLAEMRPLLQHMQFNDEQATAICATAMALGIDSLRVPSLALRVACVHAALHSRSEVVQADLAFATRAVLAPLSIK